MIDEEQIEEKEEGIEKQEEIKQTEISLNNEEKNIQPPATPKSTVTVHNPKVYGGLTLRCWNCQNINVVNEKWKVIQCPVCNKMNRVPKQKNQAEEILNYLKANTVVSWADTAHTVPLTNYVVVCPYCKRDNKIRETANHCICYGCRNKWALKKLEEEECVNNPEDLETGDSKYYKYGKDGLLYPPERALRFSDLMYPDPMFYPGYYPINSLSPLYPEFYTPYDNQLFQMRQQRMINYNKQMEQRKYHQYNNKLLEDNKLVDMIKKLDSKANQMISQKILKPNLSQSADTSSKIKGYENTFFMNKP